MTQTPNIQASHRARLRPSAMPGAGKLLGNWQLDRPIDQGSLTSVYEARPLGCPPSRPADYVVKVLRTEFASDPNALHAMRREAEVGRKCSHANLIPILEDHVDHKPPFLVMPRLEGAPLSAVVRQVGAIAVPQSLWLTRQVAQALRHLHGLGWIHGDVKPANIMVSRQGHATLIDLAFCLHPGESFYSMDRAFVGTLAYVAPELLTSTNSTRPTCDLYSLGVTLFQLLTGHLPFEHTDAARMVEAHLRDVPPEVRQLNHDVPDSVAELVRQLLAKNPLRRPQSSDELIDQLTELEIEVLDRRFGETGAA